MKVIKVKNYKEMSQQAANLMLNLIKSKPDATLGLATGSTPVGLYELLVADHQKNHTSYEQIKTVNLDEYFGIKPTNTQSYAYFMNENLFNHVNINPDNINIPSGKSANPESECDRYNEILSQNKVDVQILGIGSNGHIGFNEPGTPFNAQTHVVTLDEQTRLDNARFFDSLEEVPQYAITMGIRSILMADQIVLMATGKNKAKAVAHLLQGSVTTDCPASILQVHPNVVVIADEEALSEVKLPEKKTNYIKDRLIQLA